MPKYTTKFELNLDDMELIETALRSAANVHEKDAPDARAVNDLLGRLHNQKTFYRPSGSTYISG